jgi:hypothetical protein
LSDSNEAKFVEAARGFSGLVNDIKREEAEGRSIDALAQDTLGAEAVRYLRAVERAASDRLNRVRREESLRSAFGSILAAGGTTSLSDDDLGWRDVDDGSLEDADDDVPDDKEREHTREVLISDSVEMPTET